MDIVYPVRPGDRNEELRHSLRSLSNLPHGNVWVVGHKPPWVIDVGHLQTRQVGMKHENAGRNLVTACQSDDITDDFVWMNDDFYVMHPIDEVPTFNRGPISGVLAEMRRRRGNRTDSRYITRMAVTLRRLRELGYEHPLSFELHVPMVLNRQGVLDALRAMATSRDLTAYNKRTSFGVITGLEGARIRDPKVNFSWQSWSKSTPFLSTSDRTFNSTTVGRHIRTTFPTPSPYER